MINVYVKMDVYVLITVAVICVICVTISLLLSYELSRLKKEMARISKTRESRKRVLKHLNDFSDLSKVLNDLVKLIDDSNRGKENKESLDK